MKQIKLNDVTYSIPTGWSEVSIRQQQLAESLSDAQVHVKSLGVISAYTGIPINILKHAPTPELVDIDASLEFITTDVDNTPIFKFSFNGEEYQIADTLLKQEYQDYVAGQTAMLEFKDDKWKQLSYLVAIMAKKSGETLDSYDLNIRAGQMMDLDVQTVTQVAFFLIKNQQTSELIGVLSSPEILKLAVQNKLQELDNILIQLRQQRGKNFLIILWVWILRKYTSYLNYQWQKYLNSQASSSSKMSWMQTCKIWLLKKQSKNKTK